MEDITPEQIERFVKQVINIERKFGYELKNVTVTRREEIGAWLNKFITQEFANDNQQDRT